MMKGNSSFQISAGLVKFVQHWGQILGQNPDKTPKSFPPWYSQSPVQLCLDIFISSNSHNLLQWLQYTGKEKGGKPDRTIPPSLWFKKSTQKHQVWELSRLCLETSTKLYVHEFGFWCGLPCWTIYEKLEEAFSPMKEYTVRVYFIVTSYISKSLCQYSLRELTI